MALSKIDVSKMITGVTPLTNGGTGGTSIPATNLASGVTGTLPVGSGGTGLTSGTTDQLLKFTGSTTLASSAISTGKIGQVLQAYKTSVQYSNASSDTDISGLSIAITPSVSSSKILILSNISGFSHNGVGGGFCISRQIASGSFSKIAQADSASNRVRMSYSGDLYTGDASGENQMSMNSVTAFLDSPNTTSACTYKVVGQLNGNTLQINQTAGDVDSNDNTRTTSQITVMEVLA